MSPPNPPTEARFSDSAFLYNHLFQMANMIRGKINFESLVVNGWRKQLNKTIVKSKVLHFYLFIFYHHNYNTVQLIKKVDLKKDTSNYYCTIIVLKSSIYLKYLKYTRVLQNLHTKMVHT